jgi:DNA-binding ferritin-like protein
MKKEHVEFICNIHGYLIRLKEIHWNTNNNSEHLLCDEILDNLSDCQDRFTECAMSISDKHFKIGDLKPYLPNSKDLNEMLKELENDIYSFRKTLKSNEFGLTNVIDDMLEFCGKYKYRATQK